MGAKAHRNSEEAEGVAEAARGSIKPAFEDAHGLQEAKIGGMARAKANRACAAEMAARYGIWASTA